MIALIGGSVDYGTPPYNAVREALEERGWLVPSPTTLPNYTDWEHHVPDYGLADDGFGNLEIVELDMFWYNVDNNL